MHTCPCCGCEFDETPFATVVIDRTMAKGEWKLIAAPTPTHTVVDSLYQQFVSDVTRHMMIDQEDKILNATKD